jgi:CheY-like chemotaxis protein
LRLQDVGDSKGLKSMLQLVPGHTQNVLTQRWTTMVVEDDATLRDLMRRILEKLDFEVLAASNADEALDLAQAHGEGIDVVVTDVVMPGMDGFELASRLTGIHPTARILFLTGYSEDSPTVRDGLGLGNAFLEKPFTQVALVDQIFGLLAGPTLRLVKGN